MAASVFQSQMFSHLFPTGDIGKLFSDSAEVRAMLIVEGSLAKVQGQLGVIPEDAAAFIHRSSLEVNIDPAALAKPTGQNGVCVPGLVAAFRSEMEAPEHAQYAHWGATSQDIIDTGLMLRLRQALGLIGEDLATIVDQLAGLAREHAALPMPARTYGQHATPTSFGAVVAGWGQPLLALLKELSALREDCLWVSLSGAAGTASALGPNAVETRARLAEALNLRDPGRSWHTDRTPILRIADWMTRVTLALGKIGEDATELVQTGISEITISSAGASSTMPQKQNPVAPSVLVALSRTATALNGTLQGASVHRHQRDGAAWFTEWMTLPQIALGCASATAVGKSLSQAIAPSPGAMEAALDGGLDMIHAEALSFALATLMSRPEAQAAVKALCLEAFESKTPLRYLVARKWPELDADALFDPARQLGQATADARSFAKRAEALRSTS